MLYPRKGDDGKTKMLNCDQRLSKSSKVAEALGTLDEANSFLGLCKIKSKNVFLNVDDSEIGLSQIVHDVQQNLFIIQAQIAGALKKMNNLKVQDMEKIIDGIEKQLPPIKTFFISGGSELAAMFDVARTIIRRAERTVVSVIDNGNVKIEPESLSYLNRLSSLFYALARLSNHKSGIKEVSPSYK